jgi:hypothetical protein
VVFSAVYKIGGLVDSLCLCVINTVVFINHTEETMRWFLFVLLAVMFMASCEPVLEESVVDYNADMEQLHEEQIDYERERLDEQCVEALRKLFPSRRHGDHLEIVSEYDRKVGPHIEDMGYCEILAMYSPDNSALVLKPLDFHPSGY